MGGLERQHYIAAVIWLVLIGLVYSYFESRSRPAASVVGIGEIHIPRAPDGHFYVEGSVNGVPVRFMIDTGASSVSLSSDFARRIGLRDGQSAEFSTAGGVANGELFFNVSIGVGMLRVDGLRVAAIPSLGSEALLGQNFLRHVDIVIRDEVMLLRSKSASP